MNPSTSFQRGDRVKATNTLFKMHGTVERIQAITGLARVRWDSRPGLFGSTIAAFTEWVHPSHLALLSREVSQATFSKGDVVQVTAEHPAPNYKGVLGVVVEVVLDADRRGTQYKVRPYGPSKPFESLSRGPFTYWGHELVARRANGLVPINFVRQALGIPYASGGRIQPDPAQPDPSAWTLMGTTDGGAAVYTAPSGALPPTSFPSTSRHEGTVSFDIQIQQPNELRRALDALSRPTSIRISEAMRRRGITTEGDVQQLADDRDSAEREAKKQRSRADFTKRLLREAQDSGRQAESRARDLADERDRLRSELANVKRAMVFNTDAHVAEARKLRADLETSRYQRSFQAYQDQAAELRSAHVSRQQAENEAERLKAELREVRQVERALRDRLGSTVNRASRQAAAIERIQNAVRGL